MWINEYFAVVGDSVTVAIIAMIGSILVAAVSGTFGLLALRKSRRTEKSTDKLVRIIDNTNASPKDMLELIGKQQQAIDAANARVDAANNRADDIEERYLTEVNYFRSEVLKVRKQLKEKDRLLVKALVKIEAQGLVIKSHEKRLNKAHINGNGG